MDVSNILVGGKSSRMQGKNDEENEKALITIGSASNRKRLLDLVVESVQASNIEDFFVAVTKNTPKTADYCERVDYKTVYIRPAKGISKICGFCSAAILSSYPLSVTSRFYEASISMR